MKYSIELNLFVADNYRMPVNSLKRYVLLSLVISVIFIPTSYAVDLNSVCILEGETSICRHASSGSELNVSTPSEKLSVCQDIQLHWFHETTGRELASEEVDLSSYCDDPSKGPRRELQLPVPSVQKPTTLRLELQAHQSDLILEILNEPVRVYPEDQMKTLKEWSLQNVLVVKGESQDLENFLEAEKIEWSAVNVPTPSELTEKIMIVVGKDAVESLLASTSDMPTIYLYEEDNGLPLIRETQKNGQKQVHVRFKLANQLSSGAYAKEVFLNLIKTTLNKS